jgi:DNA-binding response OmpR family regulator
MNRGRVLVVDDNPYARQAVCLILTKAGYEVIEAEDGQTAMHIMCL